MFKFKTVEQLPDPPVSLHAPHGQKIMKDFAWRVVEELSESYESWEDSDPIVRRANALEELADATHFFIELMIFAGITAAQCTDRFPMYPTKVTGGINYTARYWTVVHRLGVAMNCLKNRPWKKSFIPTDEGQFRIKLILTYAALMQLWAETGCSPKDVHDHYFSKHEINETRIQSGQ